MLLKKFHLLMDKAGSNGSPSGNGNTPPAPTNDKDTKADGGNRAPIPPPPNEDKTPKADDKSKQDKTPSQQEDEDLTGYGDGEDDPIDDKTPPAKDDKPADDKDKKPDEDPYKDVDFKGIDKEKNKDVIEFAKSLNMSKEQAQGLIEKRKELLEKIATDEANFKTQREETHKAWAKELRDDKDFGGANFAANVKLVNDFSKNHLPSLTKVLTSNGGRLSPSEMKEIRLLALKLKDEGDFTEGDAGKSKDENRRPSDYYSN